MPDQLEAPRIWPRTAEGRCSCPYCIAIREGTLPIPERASPWLERMGGAGRSAAARAIWEDE